MEIVMLTQNLLNNLLAKKHDLDSYHAAQLAAVERCPHKIEIAVRTDLIDQFRDQIHETHGRYHIAAGRVWRVGQHRYRTYTVGFAKIPGFWEELATGVRWHCGPADKIGVGFKI
jgi:hypothetical protein